MSERKQKADKTAKEVMEKQTGSISRKRKRNAESAAAAPALAEQVAKNKQALDDIFKSAKSRSQAKAKSEAVKKASEQENWTGGPRKSRKAPRPDGAKPVRIDTDSGLPVFSSKDLCMGRGGSTPQCPFDCDCCF